MRLPESWPVLFSLTLIVVSMAGCITKPDSSSATPVAFHPVTEATEVTPVLASVIAAPRPATLSTGSICLNYELMVMNASRVAMTIESLEILDPQRSHARIALLSRNDIGTNLHLPGVNKPTAVLGPAQSGYIRVNLSFTEHDKIPLVLDHIITVTTKKPYGPVLPKMVEKVARTYVKSGPVPVIGPPLKGDRWVAIAVGGNGYHRTTIMPLNGHWIAPERWAVDWIKIDDNNRLVTGDPSKNESWPQYG
ncbi:MAG: hypothetical protein Q7J27_01300, partial [Syntrophales bacterium]|nr:hypothetical protein [Syntrophales bacterium]